MICFLFGFKSYSQETRVDSEIPQHIKAQSFREVTEHFPKNF
ncbi:hypothetical protein [Chryseobacterium taihuense]|nr:hypothetical protein [Chryseobacterium taihuense]